MRISHNTFITTNFKIEFAVGDNQYEIIIKPVVDEDWHFGDRYDVCTSLVEIDEYNIGSIRVDVYEKVWNEDIKRYLFDPDRVINSELNGCLKISVIR